MAQYHLIKIQIMLEADMHLRELPTHVSLKIRYNICYWVEGGKDIAVLFYLLRKRSRF